MAPRFHLLLLLAFAGLVFLAAAPITTSANDSTVVNSTTAPINTASADKNSTAVVNATNTTNNSTAAADTKVRFLCTYYPGITRIVLIDKKTDTILSLRAQIASFFLNKPAKFAIHYKLLNQDDDRAELVSVNTDEDARKLLALYEALVRASPNPVPIALYVRPPERVEWMDWYLLGICSALFVSLLAFSILKKIHARRG